MSTLATFFASEDWKAIWNTLQALLAVGGVYFTGYFTYKGVKKMQAQAKRANEASTEVARETLAQTTQDNLITRFIEITATQDAKIAAMNKRLDDLEGLLTAVKAQVLSWEIYYPVFREWALGPRTTPPPTPPRNIADKVMEIIERQDNGWTIRDRDSIDAGG